MWGVRQTAEQGYWGSRLWPCQDHTLPGLWEDSGYILYHPWGWFHECFWAVSRALRLSQLCQWWAAASWPGQAAGWALAGMPSWSPENIAEQPWARGSPCLFLAGEAGLGGRFLSVREDFQALRRSQGKFLGLAPQCTWGNACSWERVLLPVIQLSWNRQWARAWVHIRAHSKEVGRKIGACLDSCWLVFQHRWWWNTRLWLCFVFGMEESECARAATSALIGGAAGEMLPTGVTQSEVIGKGDNRVSRSSVPISSCAFVSCC